MKIGLIALLLVAALLLVLRLAPKPDVSGEEAKRLVAGGARLVDVRSPSEFAGGHIEGAINIPVEQLAERLAELGPKERPLVLYCHSGARSTRGAALLREQGFSEVYNLGGMSRW